MKVSLNLNFNWFAILLNRLYIVLYYLSLLAVVTVIVLLATKKLNMNSILLIILFYSLLLIILSSFGKNILGISISPTTNPVPPNNGLNGISKLNLVSGIKI